MIVNSLRPSAVYNKNMIQCVGMSTFFWTWFSVSFIFGLGLTQTALINIFCFTTCHYCTSTTVCCSFTCLAFTFIYFSPDSLFCWFPESDMAEVTLLLNLKWKERRMNSKIRITSEVPYCNHFSQYGFSNLNYVNNRLRSQDVVQR